MSGPRFCISLHVFVKPGKLAEFEAYERHVLPLLSNYGGRLDARFKPTASSSAGERLPDEIHLVSFPDEAAFEHYRNDPQRAAYQHLWEETVERTVVITGPAIDS